MTRRIKVAGSAAGAGAKPLAFRPARMNASIGVLTQSVGSVAWPGCPCRSGGETVRIGRNDHQSAPARRGLERLAGIGRAGLDPGPHRRDLLTSRVRPWGASRPSATLSTSRLSSGEPGTMAAPLLPPFRAVARRLRSRPPFFCVGPVTAHTLVDQDRTDFPGHRVHDGGIGPRLRTRTERKQDADQNSEKRSRHAELQARPARQDPGNPKPQPANPCPVRVKRFSKKMQAMGRSRCDSRLNRFLEECIDCRLHRNSMITTLGGLSTLNLLLDRALESTYQEGPYRDPKSAKLAFEMPLDRPGKRPAGAKSRHLERSCRWDAVTFETKVG